MPISPMTPPGTKVVCVDDYNDPQKRIGGLLVTGDLDGLSRGAVYHVREVYRDLREGELLVRLSEIRRNIHFRGQECGFRLDRFDRVTDISCLTDLLTRAPTEKERESIR